MKKKNLNDKLKIIFNIKYNLFLFLNYLIKNRKFY